MFQYMESSKTITKRNQENIVVNGRGDRSQFTPTGKTSQNGSFLDAECNRSFIIANLTTKLNLLEERYPEK